MKQAIEAIKFEITVLAGKPTNLPYTSLGTLFKGRDEFLAELRQHLTAKGPVVIKGKRTAAQDGVKGSVKFDANDRFAFDGQCLIATKGAEHTHLGFRNSWLEVMRNDCQHIDLTGWCS